MQRPMIEQPRFSVCACSNVQMFKCSNVQLFNCSVVQMFNCSVVQMFNCSIVLLFCCSVVQLFKCSIIQSFKCSIVHSVHSSVSVFHHSITFHCSLFTIRYSLFVIHSIKNLHFNPQRFNSFGQGPKLFNGNFFEGIVRCLPVDGIQHYQLRFDFCNML